MTLYHVVARVQYVHEVEADDPEYAAQVVQEGDGGQGEAVDAWVEQVQLPDERGEYDPLGDEVRKPWRCPIHRKEIRPGASCIDCLLGRPAA